jgi:hypothetical protein
MYNIRSARAGEPAVPPISRADNPENNAAGEVAAGVQHTDSAASPPAQDEDREVESWLGELRPPHTSDPWPAPSTNGDDPNATPAIPTRLQQDPDAT